MKDAYHEVCGGLRLCPRLVPSPLWGVSLAHLARADARALCDALGLSEGCIDMLNGLRERWFSQPRDRCAVCGLPADHLDEDWRYVAEGGRGWAVLAGVRPLCRDCHDAKHLGRSLKTGKFGEALAHLALVNGISLGEAEALWRRAYRVWEALSAVGSWELVGVGQAKEVVDAMASHGYSLDGYWLWYLADGEQARRIRERAEEEAERLFAGGPDVAARLREALGARGVEATEELNMALEMAHKEGEYTGKWMAFVPRELRGLALRRAAEALREEGLHYEAKVVGVPEERPDSPLIVYVPNFLAPGLVADVADVLRRVLGWLGLRGPLYFKPDVFTLRGIYSGRQRASIYRLP